MIHDPYDIKADRVVMLDGIRCIWGEFVYPPFYAWKWLDKEKVRIDQDLMHADYIDVTTIRSDYQTIITNDRHGLRLMDNFREEQLEDYEQDVC